LPIERIKQIAPICTRALRGGEIWIEGATADPADEDAPDGIRAMHVTIRLFARLREMAGAGEVRRSFFPTVVLRARDSLVNGFRNLTIIRVASCASTQTTRNDDRAERWRRGGVLPLVSGG
jgi:hypothetical protein